MMSALNSGYMKRGADLLPKQGDRYPWYVTNNYLCNRKLLLTGKLTGEWLQSKK